MFFLLMSACDPAPADAPSPAEAPAAPAPTAAGQLSGVVEETLPAGPYTYARVRTAAGEELWAAAMGSAPPVGTTVSFSSSMPMKNFHSEALSRDFPLVYFVESLGATTAATAPSASLPYMPGGTSPVAEAPMVSEAAAAAIPGAAALVAAAPTGPAAGLISIEKAWTDKTSLAGRQVTIQGKVVKATTGVLGRNWLHVQDGTGTKGTNDLTVTTQGTAAVGDTVTATGVLAIDRDVGSGYAYPVILLDAALGG